MSKAIMLQGTGSDVGKTVLVAGLCRLLANRGLTVRPFKPQNMSNNAAVADDGGEIGRAQWLQALACRTAPTVHMNPVLLKPQSESGSQVVMHGKVRGQAGGRDYQKMKPDLLAGVMESYRRLSAEADIVVVEGAGSPAEINLREGDIANMGFATRAKVPVLLVGDIDRGGVIASLVGTHAVLDETDRAAVHGFIINKFRGDVSLFDDGLAAITRFTGWRSFGVLPWLGDAARLPAEDSVVLERLAAGQDGGVRIAVPMPDRIANFDDLDPLAQEEGVEIVFVRPGERLPEDAVAIVIPGSKSTISDLVRFRENGWDRQIRAHVARGGHVVGICGGYQMLGRTVRDPLGIEGGPRETEGLGLLDTETEMAPEKRLENVTAHSPVFGVDVSGYEIHLGVTRGPDCARPALVAGGVPDGAVAVGGRVFGTYLHGLFDSGAFRAAWLQSIGAESSGSDHRAAVDAALDAIAEDMQRHVDIEGLLEVAGKAG
ncbi:cobyric acid synthase [Oricola thermophila]|uniref:Cobyric acid synthase n=1 Tax=Oricola thermophila TaxID=2742145 RepID=A0A6N1VDZ9_9HYPH|nr:cobyric acid synthase [Oricola thermophila]QKV17389.1 cobyric acid synthase [Oricola thermophila]